MLNNIQIGADVEVFVKNKVTDEVISAEGLIRGTKTDPFVWDKVNKHFAISLDNVLAEFCIPPTTNKHDFYDYLQRSQAYINSILPKDHCTVALPAYSLADKWLQTDQALIFGCEPDYNAYTGQQNIKPDAEDHNLRSCGGHIHISWDAPNFEFIPELYKGEQPLQYTGDAERCHLIKTLDLFVAVPALLLEPDNKRKELYGKAGCFRPKAYGLEYRTPSNFYLQSKALTHWIYDSTQAAINWFNSNDPIPDNISEYIQYTINNNDKEGAQNLITEFNLKVA